MARDQPHLATYDPVGLVRGLAALGELEQTLPITPDLRDRILTWVREFHQSGEGMHGLDLEARDDAGFRLSEELAQELGSAFTVEYHPTTAAWERARKARKLVRRRARRQSLGKGTPRGDADVQVSSEDK